MKRKLDDHDQHNVEISTVADQPQTNPTKTSFETLGLDARLLQAIAKEKYTVPTPVQAKAIPLVLEGKDVLARSKTGSGKTAAYVLPILQSILRRKASAPKPKATSALVLVPTRELAEQVNKSFALFAAFCSKDIRSVNLTQKASDAVVQALLQDAPDVVVATPARATQHTTSGSLHLADLTHLVIDEADLVLSYGYDDDLNALAPVIPRGVQTILMSATLTTEVDILKGLFCRDPVTLKLEDEDEPGGSLTQYVVKCAEDEKFLLIFVIFKLNLIKGKCIIFVAEVDRSYHLKLFLEQFGIRSCVLNAELPVNSRLHVVQEFNKGVYDIIIAADDQEVIGGVTKNHPSKPANNDEANPDDEEDEATSTTNPPPKRKQKQKDYGVSRGIDFHNVTCVLNFDLPTSSKSYTHRIGRTARAGKSGMALSFVIPSDQYRKHKPTSTPSTQHDEKVLAKISARQAKKNQKLKPYHFDPAQTRPFRYRMNDALRAVTRASVRTARTREIKAELLKSEKLKRHFEENPDDLRHLRHDEGVKHVRVQAHLKHVPDYLLPAKGRQGLGVAGEVGFVGMRKPEGKENRIRRARMLKRFKGKGKAGKKVDPLKNFGRTKGK